MTKFQLVSFVLCVGFSLGTYSALSGADYEESKSDDNFNLKIADVCSELGLGESEIELLLKFMHDWNFDNLTLKQNDCVDTAIDSGASLIIGVEHGSPENLLYSLKIMASKKYDLLFFEGIARAIDFREFLALSLLEIGMTKRNCDEQHVSSRNRDNKVRLFLSKFYQTFSEESFKIDYPKIIGWDDKDALKKQAGLEKISVPINRTRNEQMKKIVFDLVTEDKRFAVIAGLEHLPKYHFNCKANSKRKESTNPVKDIVERFNCVELECEYFCL